jgi:branched-chain amino acid transport system ATP-binding protein
MRRGGERAVSADDRSTSLRIMAIEAGYAGGRVLHGVDLEVGRGRMVALVGPNGAGKSTLLRVTAGLIKPLRGRITIGERDVTGMSADHRPGSGICLIPQGRGIFRSLTVRENLTLMCPPGRRSGIDRPIETFPVLGRRISQVAGSLSGGEQQMLAMSRAFMSGADFVLVDELSLGLAPVVVDQLFDALSSLAAGGTSLLIVEQYVERALASADDVCVLVQGRVAYAGKPDDLKRETLADLYLGGGAASDYPRPASGGRGGETTMRRYARK